MKHISLGVFDYQRNKLCDLYDSFSHVQGEAYNISFTEEQSGWKEVNFSLPFLIDKEKNYRWDYIKNEYYLRVKVNDHADWFILKTPQKTKNGMSITDTVKCEHISVLLKTKNLYLVLDEKNGIGTIQYQAGVILQNTGWTLGTCETFYERDGTTEKIRSLKSDGKKTSYQLIQDLCDLFNAYPVYNGDSKTVDLHPMSNRAGQTELTIDKNMSSLTVQTDTSNMVTRLYVEGEYGEFGYVGIDDVNPTGLSYLMDFDYYREIGLFTQTHQTALNTYLAQMPAKITQIKQEMATILTYEDQLNQLWGQIDYVIYVLDNGSIDRMIEGGTVLPGQEVIGPTDEIVVLPTTGNYRTVVGPNNFTSSDEYAVKFITLPSGGIGARQVAIESKEQMVTTLQSDYAEATTAAKRQWIQEQITAYNTSISNIWNGTTDVTGLYEAMRVAIELAVEIDGEYGTLTTLQSEQAAIESAFSSAMGDMLKDGYWSNTNYAPGQEEWLYEDAIERMSELSRPTTKFNVALVNAAGEDGFVEDTPLLNMKVRILDNEQPVNEFVYVKKRTVYLDTYNKDAIEVSNEGLRSAAVTFESILGKITELSDQVDQRSALYERAKAINANGSFPSENVMGSFNIFLNELDSPNSNWKTDPTTGALIFESVLQDSAYKIGGDGFMIADSKDSNGDWMWRTIGSGTGFVADAITDGYIDVNRVENGTITVVKLANNVGANLDISLNPTTLGIVAETGINNLATGETLYGKIDFNAQSIATEVQRAQNAEGGQIAKTSTQQTADAIVNEAVSQSATAAGNAYIAKTTTYQSATDILLAAEQYTDGHAYAQVSGIAINASGVSISGSKYVQISSGASFILDSDSLDINSTSGIIEASYNNTPYFKIGAGRTQIESLDLYSSYDSGYTDVTSTVTSLEHYGWLRNASVSGNTLTITKWDGTTINFNKAGSALASLTLESVSGSASSFKAVAYDSSSTVLDYTNGEIYLDDPVSSYSRSTWACVKPSGGSQIAYYSLSGYWDAAQAAVTPTAKTIYYLSGRITSGETYNSQTGIWAAKMRVTITYTDNSNEVIQDVDLNTSYLHT